MRSLAHKFRKGYSGSVLPMVAMMILPLILVMGFAIDTGLILNSKNQQELIVQHAALSALSQYSKTMAQVSRFGKDSQTRSDLVDEAVALVKARVSRIARTNVTIIDRRLKDMENRIGNDTEEIKEEDNSNEATDAPAMTTSDEAIIEFGQYYYMDDTDLDHPDGVCNGKPPCFVARSPNDIDKNNAIRFTMQVTKNNQIQTYILKMVGMGGVSHSASAIATLIPRNDVFLMDLSPTVYYDNYSQTPIDASVPANGVPVDGDGIPLDPEDRATVSKFTYTAMNEMGGDSTAHECDEGVGRSDRCTLRKRWDFDSNKTYDPLYYSPEELYCGASPKQPCPDGYQNLFNYRQNYKIVTVNFKTDLYDVNTSESFKESFIIHAQDPRQNSAHPFPKPQPMTSIFRAVNSGMEILTERALSADNLGVFAFDSDRNFETSDDGLIVSENPRYIDMAVPDKKRQDFKNFLSATRFDNQVDFDTALSLGLFPRTFTFSDLQAALYLGLSKISGTTTFRYAKNSIFLFTDGLANCPHETIAAASDPSKITIPYLFKNPMFGAIDDTNCDGKNPKNLIEGIKRIIEPTFVKAFKDRNISVNIAILGKHAHQIARKSYTKNGCMDASEASNHEYSKFVDSELPEEDSFFTNYQDAGDYEPGGTGEAYIQELRQRAANGQPQYITAELYKIVHETKGMWIPIIPPLMSAGQPVIFRDNIETACKDALSTDDYKVIDYEVNGVKVTDSKGRLLYDPDGRSPEQQMKEAMELVLQSPFVLAQ